MTSDALPHEVFDVVGIGFGPSNLALAIAVDEHNRRHPEVALRAVFLEKQAGFGWHRGMLIDDATMQVSFLKDLVTMRDPASDFSFLCYLRDRDRLVEFINHKTMFPLRTEFHDYFEWAAARVADQVRYGTEVVSVRPVEVAGQVEHLDVIAHRPDGTVVTCRARNVVVATGLRPRLPADAVTSERVWHNIELMHRIGDLVATKPRRVLVVGAGQSGAETVAELHTALPDAEVCAVFARYGYAPADDSPFANRIFDPRAVDHFYGAPEDVKQMLLDYHRNTNYSVVDMDLIEDLYRREYRELVTGRKRLDIRNASRVTYTRETDDAVYVTVEFLPTGETQTIQCDAVVYATGYTPGDVFDLLGRAASVCERGPEGRPVLARDYRLRTAPGVRAGIYLQGGTEHAHGITATLLSNTAVRVGEILESVLTDAPAQAVTAETSVFALG
ncbi:lysine N(6)-hydroxylase/L-ornithine N(5)-oxygenase family protein [Actinokineospora sp. NBRC 105648]|uniref:lysine N(6)-hydroxylase/L-ornithine N(5)-oxygenase family protein n=1 Tax=Actinokineospora sp. NBRC 105648 TaxID=3032206 RepID=UPI0024A3D645|nr:lysine N(6)-hydroxylase/L-ornithine N(5)-oxygenase family protein [Actinokineospora sp. NBRC 105648]GLZ40418.1 lysine/ornithine N-monooxygenase [Actinokineospora sp. NBRC 105648]